MAITNSDGSIILSTKVDTSGIRKGMSQIKGDAGGLTKTFGKLASAIGLAFSVTAIVQFSRESAKLATQTEASVQRLIDIYGKASDSVGDFIDANARALGMSKAAAASYASVYGNLFSVWADQKTNAELTNHYLNMTAVVASKTGRTVEDVQERIRSGLLGNTEAIEDLGIFVNVKTIEITDAFQRIADGRSWEQLTAYEQSQVRTLAILEQSTKKYGTQVADTTQSVRLRFQAAYEDFKNTWGQLVNTILIPILSTLTKIFSVATAVINTLTGNTGGILGDSSQADTTGQIRDNIAESTENQEEFTGAIEETNKELKKTLAGFDDLQILSRPSESAKEQGIPGVGGGIAGNDGLELPALPQIGQQEQFDPMAVVAKIKDALDFILPLISISLVVIGLILLSAGQIGWGLGFIIGGAYLYSVTERSDNGYFDFSVVMGDINAILPYIDEALVAIGLVLMFLGQIPWGIGFIIAGAAVYAAEEVLGGEKYNEADTVTKLAVIAEAVATSLVAIGVLLLFLGNIPLGLGFIVVGAKALEVVEQQLNKSDVETEIQAFFEKYKQEIVAGSIAFVVLGILLLFVPCALGLSLALIAGGASALVTESKITGEPVFTMLQDFVTQFETFLKTAAWAMFALGVLLVMTGAGVGFGIALMIAGLTLMGFTEAVLNWDALLESVAEACTAIEETFFHTVNTVIGWLNALGFNISALEMPEGPELSLPKNWDFLDPTAPNPLFKEPRYWEEQFAVTLPDGVELPNAVTGQLLPSGISLTRSANTNSFTSSTVDLITDAVSRGMGAVNAQTEVVLEIDGREFGRAVVEQGGIESRRIGTRLVID